MTNEDLSTLTTNELIALKAKVEDAIRAAIRAKNAAKAANGPSIAPGTGTAAPPTPANPLDLERERDAWLASRR